MEKVNSSGFIERNVPKKKRLNKLGKVVLLFLFLLLAIVIYFIFAQKINSIKVIGNTYIKDEYILEQLDLAENSSLFNVIFNFNKGKIKKNDMINNVDISIENLCVTVKIDENKAVGWRQFDGINQLILSDGLIVDVDSTCSDNYKFLPYFVDISNEKVKIIAEEFAKIDNDILYRISEVHNLSFTYDSNMIKLVMDEGNYICCSLKGIPYIKNYLQIIANDRNENNKCILIMEEYNKALKTNCDELEKYKTSQNEEE